jgi:hypothetical protein
MSDWFLEQWLSMKFYVKLGISVSDICALLSEALRSYEAMKKSSVFEWHKWFKGGRMWKYWSGYVKLCIERGLNFGTVIGFSTMTMLHLRKHSMKQFVAQKLITKREHPPCSPALALNDLWLFLEVKSALKGWVFRILTTKMWQLHCKLFHNGVPK